MRLAIFAAMVLASNQWLVSAPGDIVMDNHDGGLTHFVAVSNGTPWPYLYARPPEPRHEAKAYHTAVFQNAGREVAYIQSDGGCFVRGDDGGFFMERSRLCSAIFEPLRVQGEGLQQLMSAVEKAKALGWR